ncbi:RNA recognition motif containing protein [Nitzschia inconspicua]|uniref:RNA recognition motif containing protein n=1 Tax=Nitzschia inconspicua TaxID=303405 RepID=A0A9K3LJQ1_9STRA|nr:RNA recognition motif containing protein [Nitzschia inconspicua]
MRIGAVLLSFAGSACLTGAWAPVSNYHLTRRHQATSTTRMNMAIDYNDPVVAEEFQKVQPLSWDEVEEELMESGIRAPQTMNDMELKLMLVEMRLRLAGKLEGNGKPKQRPTTFSSKFEEAMWTKPAFEAFYNELKKRDDHNSMNVVAEYLNTPDIAKVRYASSYAQLLQDCEAALLAPPPVNSPTLVFSGFPANMGENALKMTLEALGPIVDIECTQDDDFPVLRGKVTFEDIESAKKAVAQYNGMDMGMGTLLEMSSV